MLTFYQIIGVYACMCVIINLTRHSRGSLIVEVTCTHVSSTLGFQTIKRNGSK